MTAQATLGVAFSANARETVPAFVSGGTLTESVVSSPSSMTGAAGGFSPQGVDGRHRLPAAITPLADEPISPTTIAGSWEAAVTANFVPTSAAPRGPALPPMLSASAADSRPALFGGATRATAFSLPPLLLGHFGGSSSAPVSPLRDSVPTVSVSPGFGARGAGPAGGASFKMISPSLATRSLAR